MRFLSVLILSLLSFTDIVRCQSLHYINYDVKDGLAGSVVYTMCQDKDGFMWFGTENGLSRYDGTHFKNFTIKDGLPDNEVLKVYGDSKGRVWIGTFSKDICYYKEGKIYTRENSELLKKIELENNLTSVFEAKNNLLCIASKFMTIIITPEDSILSFNHADICESKNCGGVSYNSFGRIRFETEDHIIYDFNPDTYSWQKKFSIDIPSTISNTTEGPLLLDSLDKKKIYVEWPGQLYSINYVSNIPKFISTTNGAWLIDSVTFKASLHFLNGYKVSNTLQDIEDNIWFSTLGNGIYKLPSLKIKTLRNEVNNLPNKEIYSLVKYKNSLIGGSNYSKIYFINNTGKINELNLFPLLRLVNKFGGDNRLFSSVNISDDIAILGFDGCIGKIDDGKYSFKYVGGPVKSVEKINDSYFIAGTAYNALKIRLKDLAITDTLWKERCTKVLYNKGKYYIGTLSGLYEISEDKKAYYLGQLHPVLTRRITDMKADANGLLWIATSDKGIIALDDRKTVKVIDDNNGLSSNNCKTLFIKDNFLWVGTNNGISKIQIYNGTKNEITRYSISDGLPSNNINALYVTDSAVWVGSPAGVTFFKEKDISATSMCHLVITRIIVSGKSANVDSIHQLSYKNNDIRFEYSGISFRSAGEIVYYYKLNGLDTGWKSTNENILDYKTLPYGDYSLDLYAQNKYGVKSNTIHIPFSIAAPFWKTKWFYFLLALIILTIVIYIFNRRNNLTKQRLEETNRLQKQFADLEQQALQAQMNPHFIFNCLNSIQQYILTRETEKANQYLTEFAHLIRQTLNISSQKTISVRQEMEYLNRYLEMEQLRFGNSFTYVIKTEGTVDTEKTEIPSLLIQPFVENAIRHGIRNLTDKKGLIEVIFTINNEILSCFIRDNGVGRQKAAAIKSTQPAPYQSKGISLTFKRIELLNKIFEKKITSVINDLKDANGIALGTEVELKIPL